MAGPSWAGGMSTDSNWWYAVLGEASYGGEVLAGEERDLLVEGQLGKQRGKVRDRRCRRHVGVVCFSIAAAATAEQH